MRFNKILAAAVLTLVAYGLFSNILNESPNVATGQVTNNQFTIPFKSGHVIPNPNQSERVPTASGHLIVQFENPYTNDDLNSLEGLGVIILTDISPYSILVSVPDGVNFSTIDGIRWSGPVPPNAKISNYLETTSARSLEPTYFMVDFHLDVDPNVVRNTVELAGGTIHERDPLPATTVLVLGTPDVILALAIEDDVTYIYPANDTAINTNDFFHCPGGMSDLGLAARFVNPTNDGWDGAGLGSYALTYNFTNGTTDITGTDEEAIVIAGITEWSKVIDVSFTATGSVDAADSMQILWGTGDHSATSGYNESGATFDGVSGTLAHAYFPGGSDISGDMHYDDAEDWTNTSSWDLFSVTMHEAGHALGMNHSDDPDAVMFPTASLFAELQSDDVERMQLLYDTPSELSVYTMSTFTNIGVSDTITIIWIPGDGTGANVSLALYKDGVFQGYISSSTTNDGFYDWAIPAGLLTSSGYSIRVASVDTPSTFADLALDFSINVSSFTAFASTDVTQNIPDNSGGSNFGSFSEITIPEGYTGFTDVTVTNIGIDYSNQTDLAMFLGNATMSFGQGFTLTGGGVCPGTTLVSSVPFGFDDNAPTTYGSVCPPANDTSYQASQTIFGVHGGIDPEGTWTLILADQNNAVGSSGTLTSWTLNLETADADPGNFTPVSVDLNATSPGAGTSNAPYTVLEPAASIVTTSGTIEIEPGTYTAGALTINTAMTLTNNDGGSGVVTLQ